jgi:hypothetical protein
MAATMFRSPSVPGGISALPRLLQGAQTAAFIQPRNKPPSSPGPSPLDYQELIGRG